MLKSQFSKWVLFFVVIYAFFANGIGIDPGKASDYYGLLADAFLSGKLSLNIKPSPQLLQLPDPYDYIQNTFYRLHDASLYKGQYYLYWGPIPAIVRILALNKIPEPYFNFSYILGCTIISVLILKNIKEKYFKRINNLYLYATFISIGLNGIVLNLIISRGIYYEAITAAQFFFLGGVYFFLKSCLHKSNSYMFISHLFFALSFGSRVSYALPALPFLSYSLIKIFNIYRYSNLKALFNKLLYVFMPVIVVVILLGLYNYGRFGNALDFGRRYMLAGEDMRKAADYDVHYMPNNIKNFLFALPSFENKFPFIYMDRNYYNNFERITFSIFLLTPFAIFFLYRPRGKNINSIYRQILLALILMVFSVSTFLKTSATRSMFDFIYLFNILGAIGFLQYIDEKIKSKQSLGLIKSIVVVMLTVTLFFGFIMWLKAGDEYDKTRFNTIKVEYLRFNHKISTVLHNSNILDLYFQK